MGQKRYSPKALKKGIREYFDSVSRTVTAREAVDSGKRDEKGHVIYDYIDIVNDAGEPIRYREYVVPPTITALCRFLGISRETWRKYMEDDGELGTAARGAKEQIEEYLETQLYREKQVQGIMFNLQHNYGWKERRDLETRQEISVVMTGETEDYGG